MLLKKLAIALYVLSIAQVAMADIPTTITDENTVRNHDGSPFFYDGYQTVYDDDQKIHLVLEISETREIITTPLENYKAMVGQDYLNLIADFFYHRNNFFSVTNLISRDMEEAYNVYIVVNLAPSSGNKVYEADQIPAQHMRVLRKTHRGQKVFDRSGGKIVGINPDVLGMGTASNPATPAYDCLSGQIPRFSHKSRNTTLGLMKPSGLIAISSGKGPAGGRKNTLWRDHKKANDTPTGIYRFGLTNSTKLGKGRSYINGNPNNDTFRSMYFPIYFDLIYPEEFRWKNKLSNLAMHGTSTKKYARLGNQDSLGCVRTNQQINWCVKSQFFDLPDEFESLGQLDTNYGNRYHAGPVKASVLDNGLPNLDPRYRLKGLKVDPDTRDYEIEPGVPALFILFYDYDEVELGSQDSDFNVIDI